MRAMQNCQQAFEEILDYTHEPVYVLQIRQHMFCQTLVSSLGFIQWLNSCLSILPVTCCDCTEAEAFSLNPDCMSTAQRRDQKSH